MRKGFSLIEVIVVVSIAISIVLVVSNLGGNISILNGLIGQELQSKSNVSQALQIMTTDVRSASPSANGAYPIDTAASATFIFYSDPDNDGVPERVRYYYASSSIFQGVIQPTGTPATYPTSAEVVTDIVDNVITPATSTPLFSYYDSSYTGSQPAMTSTASVASIRLIGVTFYADVQTQQSPGPEYFSALMDVRNLRSN